MIMIVTARSVLNEMVWQEGELTDWRTVSSPTRTLTAQAELRESLDNGQFGSTLR